MSSQFHKNLKKEGNAAFNCFYMVLVVITKPWLVCIKIPHFNIMLPTHLHNTLMVIPIKHSLVATKHNTYFSMALCIYVKV